MPHSWLNECVPAQSWKAVKGELVKGVFEDSCRCSRFYVKTVRDSMSITNNLSFVVEFKGMAIMAIPFEESGHGRKT